ncbi:PilT/PilU family type 4a pilus ATPase [Halomonas piscis]|uniref:PilT/PilU family type 4a pilus ATPase n=1 Tax=Halomonas piscis TaxID=3031727 RepID=UPI00289BE2CC|nr:PilT/PilU family type 4a pilus ATPase [Halomonas piscis]
MESTAGASAEQLVHTLLTTMIERQASDLLISVGVPPTLKMPTGLEPVTAQPLDVQQVTDLVMHVLPAGLHDEFEQTREVNFALSLSGTGRFRVNAFQQRHQVAMVVRRIALEVPRLSTLGVPGSLAGLAQKRRGLVLVVGGTGTGKSTTLAAMIQERNETVGGHIISIEDPIEYIHPHKRGIVNQREVGIDTESFEAALKNTLRQAPDVILIGEIRTRETMEHALTFAETGHLCLATLHANNANQALDRILHFFPYEQHEQILTDLSLNLHAIVAQQLLPTPDEARCAAVEIMLRSPRIADLIRKGRIGDIKEAMARSRDGGMQTFDQALCDLVQAGKVSESVALAHADSANNLRLMLKFGAELDAVQKGATLESRVPRGLSLRDADDF